MTEKMYKVMLVDDEPWVIASLVQGIPWDSAGCKVVATATDGEDALIKIREYTPDILVTDIRMPVMDGLELIKKAHADIPCLKFIIISGHAEFEYARRAMAFGVSSYCLKPVDQEEMIESLSQVKIELDQVYEQRLSIIQNYIEEENLDGCIHYLKQLGFDWSENRNVRVLVGLDSEAFPLSKRHKIYLVTDDQYVQLKQKPLSSSVGLSEIVSHPLRLNKAVNESMIARAQDFVTKKHGLYIYHRSDMSSIRQKLHDIRNAVYAENLSLVLQCTEELRDFIVSHNCHIKQLYYCYARILDIIDESDGYVSSTKKETDVFMDSWQELTTFYKHVDEVFNALKEQLTASMNHEQSECVLEATDSLIQRIIRKVETDCAEEISLAALAEKYHVTTSHLCRCFKQKTGTTFTAYVNETRIKKARKLLKETGLQISKVAELSGFDNYFYFARIFKRSTGLTPTQFREN